MATAAIIPAAGLGVRLRANRPKAFVELGGISLLAHATRALVDSHVVDHIIVSAPADYVDEVQAILDTPGLTGSIKKSVVVGGATRRDSVESALKVLGDDIDVVLVHDAARALAPADLVARVEATVRQGHVAVVPGLPVADTLKKTDPSTSPAKVLVTLNRTGIQRIQTPQGFSRSVLEEAHRTITRSQSEITDDAMLVELMDQPVVVIDGDEYAMKITTPLDLAVAATSLGLT